jgi:hypothetical protein
MSALTQDRQAAAGRENFRPKAAEMR